MIRPGVDRMILTSNVTDTALIFEGGGMRASYSSGLVATLLGADIHIDWVAGISAGSSCTVNYLARDAERAERAFVDFAAESQFGGVRTFLRGQGLFNAQWIYEETGLPGGVLPFDFATFSANPARLSIGAVHCASGDTVSWTREDVTTVEALMKRVRASSTMPVLMPLTTIDGEDYVDGALGSSGGIALDAARDAGFERFLVVLTQQRGYRKRPPRNPGFYRRYFRQYPRVAEAILTRWQRYNATLDELERLEAQGRAYVFRPERMTVSNSEKDVPRLRASFDAGYAQAQRELPAMRDFLGL